MKMSCYQKSSFDSMVYVSIIGLDKQCEVYFQTLKVQENDEMTSFTRILNVEIKERSKKKFWF